MLVLHPYWTDATLSHGSLKVDFVKASLHLQPSPYNHHPLTKLYTSPNLTLQCERKANQFSTNSQIHWISIDCLKLAYLLQEDEPNRLTCSQTCHSQPTRITHKLYMLTHRDPETPGWTKYLYEAATKDLKIYSTLLDEGVSHGDDLALLFSKGTFKSDKIEKITQLLVSNWANFVSKGSPLIPKEIWPPVQAGGPVLYYNVSTIPHMSKSPFKQKESNFWRKTIPYIEKTLSPKEQNENQGLTPWILGAIFTYFLLSFMNRQQFNPIL
ncbi:hypothetical protein SK128_015695 [Halocaridina rubra]|uniref:Carboxylesterase n=1 Tax=Halocaridina rubra TaxID=373956 RepID=A0AAN9A4J6_HALRR